MHHGNPFVILELLPDHPFCRFLIVPLAILCKDPQRRFPFINPTLGQVIGPRFLLMFLLIPLGGAQEKGNTVVGPGDDHGLADGPYPQNAVAAKTIAQNNIVIVPICGFVDLFLDRGRHFLGSTVEGLLEENERHSSLLEVKKLILHDATGNDPIFLG
jgi:hypothetical protein